jgi:hypothetical protein
MAEEQQARELERTRAAEVEALREKLRVKDEERESGC